MKTAKHAILSASLVALVTPAFAIEGPPEEVPSIQAPAEASQPAAEDPAPVVPLRGGRVERRPEVRQAVANGAYLGLGSGAVPEILSAHIGLKPGEGVIVRSLDPTGPAAKAGFAINDVILKIDGKAIASHAELSGAVSAKHPGDELAVDFIHAGKQDSRKVILGTRPENEIGMMPQREEPSYERFLQGMPPEQAKRFRESFERGLGGRAGIHDLSGDMGMDTQVPEIDQVVREMQNRMQRMLEGNPGADAVAPKEFNLNSESTVRLMDDKGSVEIKNKNGAKEVKVFDKSGSVVWSGPWETEKDRGKAPDDVRQRVDALKLDMNFKGGGLRLQFGSRAPDPLIDQ
ncbi:PDZ domain-containing protein [Luteolibacter sp. LG18]|uniref:S1C family serine protease n=1 Tax=Luteolibacter sp. LG18 TaxID=2819286 RepID=UPI002B2B9D77|nr:hypothetical protein llg_44490 [Luteolibacter sp. LG18]